MKIVSNNYKKECIYKNRYKDEIKFTRLNFDTIEMTGHSELGMRYGFNNDNPNIITMVDPSGGPYITLGTDLDGFFQNNKKMIIKSIKIEDNKVIFKI